MRRSKTLNDMMVDCINDLTKHPKAKSCVGLDQTLEGYLMLTMHPVPILRVAQRQCANIQMHLGSVTIDRTIERKRNGSRN